MCICLKLGNRLAVGKVIAIIRSSATAEKQRVSCACLPRLANWSCNTQHTAESQRLYYFWHSNALIQEVLARKRILSWNSRSRSFTVIHRAIICRSTRGSISPHIIACRIDNPQCRLTPAPKATPANIRMNLIFSETRFIGLHFCCLLYTSPSPRD